MSVRSAEGRKYECETILSDDQIDYEEAVEKLLNNGWTLISCGFTNDHIWWAVCIK